MIHVVNKSLTKTEKFRYFIFVACQILLGLLDLIALTLVSLTSILIIQGRVDFPASLNRLGLEKIFVIEKVFVISVICAFIFIFKTLLSLIQARAIMNYACGIQNRLVSNILAYSTNSIFSEETYLLQRVLPIALNEGISALCLGIIGYSLLALSEVILLFGIGVALIFLVPVLTTLTILIFGLAFFVIHKLTSKWSMIAGKNKVENFQKSKKAIDDLLLTLKSVKVSDQYASFNSRILKASNLASKSNGDIHLVQQVPKYVLELTVVSLGVLLGLFFAVSNNMSKSIGILVLFLGGLFRLLPSLLRLQGAILIIQSSIGESFSAVKILEVISPARRTDQKFLDSNPLKSVVPGISLSNVSFSYPNSKELIFSNFSCEFPSGEMTSIKGASGVGKTTLADLALGLILPTAGNRIVYPQNIVRFTSSYLPQEISLIQGTFAENVALGVEHESIDNIKVAELSNRVGLDTWLSHHSEGIMVQLDKSGVQLSGGQKQRLGLARALYFDPVLLVVDEPTSALDSESEDQILEIISGFKNVITIIIIAHTEKPDKYAQNFVYLK